MTKSYSTFSFYVVAVLLVSVVGDQSFCSETFQQCTCSGPFIDCENRDLTTLQLISNQNNSGFSTLALDVNHITNIRSGSLPPSLTEISLIDNPLTSIDDRTFDESASTLLTVLLSGFHFSRFPDAFSHLKVLKDLSIYGGDVQDWNEDAMKNIGLTLDTLYLSNLGLKSWPMWIQYCTNLTRLSVVDSEITFVPDRAMDMLANRVEYLYLYNNSLSAVPKAISNFTALQELDLERNKITDVSWLPRYSKLQGLSLSYNSISDADSLSKALQPYGESLTNVELDGNLLSSIPNLELFTKVKNLDFTSNKISDPNSGSLSPKLDSINFSFNLLPYVPPIVSKLPSISDLLFQNNAIIRIQDVNFPPAILRVELGFNLITELTDTSFPQNSSIQYVHLNNNPIASVSSLAFKNLPTLTELNMQSTKLTRLPVALIFLKNLIVLDMSDSTYLVCTCQEKSLERLVLSMLASNVVGSCGHTDIYYFFSTLSPSCPAEQ